MELLFYTGEWSMLSGKWSIFIRNDCPLFRRENGQPFPGKNVHYSAGRMVHYSGGIMVHYSGGNDPVAVSYLVIVPGSYLVIIRTTGYHPVIVPTTRSYLIIVPGSQNH